MDKQQLRDEFSERLKLFLQRSGLTQQELAHRIGVTKNTPSNWQHQKSFPDIWEIVSASKELGIEPSHLAYGAGPTDPAETALLNIWRQSTEFQRELALRALQPVAAPALPTPAQASSAPAAIQAPAKKQPTITISEPERRIHIPRENRRHELEPLMLDHAGPKRQRIHGYSGLAAGPGRELERCTDIYYIRNDTVHGSDHVYARIRGDSMMDTILPGDVGIFREFKTPITLNPIGNDDPKSPLNMLRVDVPEDTIWIVQINDDEPTLKRIRYETRAGSANWTLMIEADNRDVWPSYPTKRSDAVRFWARFKYLARISQEE